MKQELFFVPTSKKVDLGRVLPIGSRIWTLYDGNKNPEYKFDLPIKPVHFLNAYLEERVNDWRQDGTILKYYSRISDGNVWILVEEK